MSRAICLCLTMLFAAGSMLRAEAADPGQIAERAAADLAAAAQALRAAEGARDRVAALTRTVQAYEDGLGALRDGLRSAAIRDRALQAEFDAEAARLSGLLGILLSMQTSPETLVLLHPSGPVETARAGMIVADVVPALDAEVAGLRSRLEEMAALRAVQDSAAATLSEGLEGVRAARTALSQAMSDRVALPPPLAEDAAAMQALIDSAETLDAFASSLAQDSGAGAGDDFAAVRGLLPLPVAGVMLRGFGEADAAGIRRPGLVIATRPRALVTAPWPATVRYAGPLLDYGNVIILEPETGYLLVLAGLGALYARPGEVVDAGAAVGLMGGDTPLTETILVDAADGGGQDRTETLYIELRDGQEPTDPADWFLTGAE